MKQGDRKGGMGVSNRKKSRVIHVDKLIIHADDVVIVPRRRIRDPWLFPHRADVEAIEDVHEESSSDDHGRDDREEERRPFSWI
jgi:hypothetical protein